MANLDWNDLQTFLAVVRSGRLTVAAQVLGVNHSTLSRKIVRLETTLKTRLFERHPSGYVMTPAGEWLAQEAETIESRTIGIQTQLTEKSQSLAGSVRIGAPEGFGTHFLAARIGALSKMHPDLQIELIANPRVVSLSKREADMSITNYCPTEGQLYASKITDYELGFYATNEYLAAAPPVETVSDLRNHVIVGYIPDLLPTFAHNYLKDVGNDLQPKLSISNILTQMEVTLGDAGLCIIPCFMAYREPRLTRVLPQDVRIFREYWLVIHSDLRDIARVRAAAEFITKTVRKEHRLFLPSGRPPPRSEGSRASR